MGQWNLVKGSCEAASAANLFVKYIHRVEQKMKHIQVVAAVERLVL
jgi:hypothetical protein